MEKGDPGEVYTVGGKLLVRLLASNRELMGPALIKYVRDKCAAEAEKVPNGEAHPVAANGVVVGKQK